MKPEVAEADERPNHHGARGYLVPTFRVDVIDAYGIDVGLPLLSTPVVMDVPR